LTSCELAVTLHCKVKLLVPPGNISQRENSSGSVALMKIVTLIAVLLITVLAVCVGRSERFCALGYDELHRFDVGKYQITIRTRSLSISSGDNGAAELVVECPSGQKILESRFDNDLYSDLRPAYVTWADIDEDGYQDLVIWKPGLSHQVEANEFVSGIDGEVHGIAVQCQRPLPDGFYVW
jgi:hypothetical protein